MSISATILSIILGTFSVIEYKKSLQNDVLNTMKMLSDDILEHQMYTADENDLKNMMLSKDNYHHENYIGYMKYIDFKYTKNINSLHYDLMVKEKLPDGKFLVIYSSDENIYNQVKKFLIHLSIGFIIVFIILVGVFYILLKKLFKPLRCLVDYCNSADPSVNLLPSCSGSYEIKSLKDAIINLQNNNQQLCKDKQDIFKEAAHEIKTPIAILKARLSLFSKSDMKKSDFVKESMEDISTISNKLRELIFLKAIEWDIQKAKESVQMQNQCEMMQQLFHPILEKKDIKMVSNLDEDFTLYIHKEAIARVMQAVFENIFMHTKNGTTIHNYIDSKKHELKIVNEIGEESDEILFSSHIGKKLISRLAEKLDYEFETYEKDGFFHTRIQFKAQEKQNCAG